MDAVERAAEALEDAVLRLTGRDVGTIHRDEIARAVLDAVGFDALRDERDHYQAALRYIARGPKSVDTVRARAALGDHDAKEGTA